MEQLLLQEQAEVMWFDYLLIFFFAESPFSDQLLLVPIARTL